MREIADTWGQLDVEIEQLVEIDGTVVAFLREIGQSRSAGLEVRRATAINFEVAHDRVVQITGYLDREEALRDASRTD